MDTNVTPARHAQETRDLCCILAAAKAAVQVYVKRTSLLESDFVGRSNVPEYVAEYRARQIENATAVVVAMVALFEDPDDKAHMLANASEWTTRWFNEAK